MDFDTFFDVAMEHLQSVTRTETVIGEPFEAGGRRFVPITEIRLGIGAGGGEAGGDARGGGKQGGGGGLGGGFRVSPVAVVCMEGDAVRVLPVRQRKGTMERLLDLVPEALARLREAGATVQELQEAAARARSAPVPPPPAPEPDPQG
jgi:uncharacterized spore protein YtfJ